MKNLASTLLATSLLFTPLQGTEQSDRSYSVPCIEELIWGNLPPPGSISLIKPQNTSKREEILDIAYTLDSQLPISIPLPSRETFGFSTQPVSGDFTQNRSFSTDTRFHPDRITFRLNSGTYTQGIFDQIRVETKVHRPLEPRLLARQQFGNSVFLRGDYDVRRNDMRFTLTYEEQDFSQLKYIPRNIGHSLMDLVSFGKYW
ncbi:MAG: hypothetical protein ACMXYA_01995 [Candidatus Woesearchaeota archaeon]